MKIHVFPLSGRVVGIVALENYLALDCEVKPDRGEFVFRLESESETDRDNAAAKRIDRAQRGRGMSGRRAALG